MFDKTKTLEIVQEIDETDSSFPIVVFVPLIFASILLFKKKMK